MLLLQALGLAQLVEGVFHHRHDIREVLVVHAGDVGHYGIDDRLGVGHLLHRRLVVGFRIVALGQRRLGRLPALRLHEKITLHLQVQRRAELGAVVGIDAFLVGLELDRDGLAGFDGGMRVVGRHGEAVGLVLGALEVGQVDGDLVAHVRLDGLGRDVRTDQRAIDRDLVAFLLGPLLARADGARMRLVGAGIGADLVAHARLQLGCLDGNHIVGLTQRQRHVVEELHLVVADVDQLVVLRMQRTHRHEAVDGQLVQRDEILALRLGRVAFHGHQVADVVMHAELVEHLAFAVVPLRHLRVHIQRGVGDAGLGVVLRMQRTEAQRHLHMHGVLQADHRDAVGILALELAGLDGSLDLLEAVDRDVGVELAGNDHELAVGRDVDAVRALRFRHEEEDAFLDGRVHHDHVVAVDLLGLAGLDQLGGLLPVDHVQVVGVLGGAAGLVGRAAFLDAADVALGAEGVGERPAVGRTLAEVGKILRVRRQFEREGLSRLDAAFLAVELPVGDAAAVLLVELLEREELLVLQRRGVLRGLDDVLGVRADEGAAVFGLEDRVDHDLLGLEVAQIDHGDARVGLVVDEEELAVILAVGLGNCRVVRIAPGDVLAVDLALCQHGLGVLVVAVALPGLGGEYADVLEDAHRRHGVDDDLAALAAGTEGDEFVALAGRHIGFRRSQKVLLGKVAAFQDILQRFRRQRGGGSKADPGRKRQ